MTTNITRFDPSRRTGRGQQLIRDRQRQQATTQPWPEALVHGESTEFVQRHGDLTGHPEESVLALFGPPQASRPGSRMHFEGKEHRAEHDLGYLDLLPHVEVWFSIRERHVLSVMFGSKWRTQ